MPPGHRAEPPITIRPARPGDGPVHAGIWLDFARYYAEMDDEAFRVPHESGLVEWFEAELAKPLPETRFWVVAELDGRIVGFLTALIEDPVESADKQLVREVSERRLVVSVLGVEQISWRKGVGTALMEAAERWGHERGATIAMLDTYVRSPVSVPFYEEGMGYRRRSLRFVKPIGPESRS